MVVKVVGFKTLQRTGMGLMTWRLRGKTKAQGKARGTQKEDIASARLKVRRPTAPLPQRSGGAALSAAHPEPSVCASGSG